MLMSEISDALSPAELTRVKCRFKCPPCAPSPVLQIYPLPPWSPKSKRLLLRGVGWWCGDMETSFLISATNSTRAANTLGLPDVTKCHHLWESDYVWFSILLDAWIYFQEIKCSTYNPHISSSRVWCQGWVESCSFLFTSHCWGGGGSGSGERSARKRRMSRKKRRGAASWTPGKEEQEEKRGGTKIYTLVPLNIRRDFLWPLLRIVHPAKLCVLPLKEKHSALAKMVEATDLRTSVAWSSLNLSFGTWRPRLESPLTFGSQGRNSKKLQNHFLILPKMQPTALFSEKKEQIGTATLGQVELEGKESVIDYCQRTGTRPTLKCSVWGINTRSRSIRIHVGAHNFFQGLYNEQFNSW